MVSKENNRFKNYLCEDVIEKPIPRVQRLSLLDKPHNAKR